MRRWAAVAVLAAGCIPSGMPTNLTPATPPTYPASFSAPADGDNGAAASVDTIFQQSLDAAEAGRQLLVSTRLMTRYYSRDGVNVVIRALGNVLVTSAGVWGVYAHAADTVLDPTVSLGGGLAVSSRYHIYAKQVGGVIGFVVPPAGDSPDIQLEYSGASNQRFVGVFFTDETGLIIPFSCSNGHFRYSAQATEAAVDNGLYPSGGESGYSALRLVNLTANSDTTPAIKAVPTFASNVVLNYGIFSTQVMGGGTGFIASVQNPQDSGYIGAGSNPYSWFAKAPYYDGSAGHDYAFMGVFDYPVLNNTLTAHVKVTNYSSGRLTLSTAGFDY